MNSTYLFEVQSALIIILLTLGVYFRKNRRRHIQFMGIAITWDLILVLEVELTRSVIAKATHITENSWLTTFHVSIATLTVVALVAMVLTGIKLAKGQESTRKTHRMLGILAYCLRLLTFITSFYA